MSWHSSFETDEPEVAAQLLSEAYVDVGLSLADEEKDFRLRLDRFDTGLFQLDSQVIGAAAGFGYVTSEEFFVSRVNRGRLRLVQPGIDERFVGGDLALIGRPEVESRTETEDFGQNVVTLHAPSLREAAGLDPDSDLLPAFASVRPVSAALARTWQRAVDFVGEMLAKDPEIADAPLVVGSANRMLADLVLAVFPNDATAPPTLRDERDARPAGTINRAVSFVESNADLDIGIGEIAAAAQVSRRAVQLAFRRHLDTTPTAYLRRIRLDQAHSELVAAAPGDNVTVTEVAYRWGFSSPSRFAERYRVAFGCSPSETLRG